MRRITNALYTSSQTSYVVGHFKEINFPFENMHGMSLGQKSFLAVGDIVVVLIFESDL